VRFTFLVLIAAIFFGNGHEATRSMLGFVLGM